MQLKKDPEPEITKETIEETAKESGFNNNDFFNPEQEFDFQGDGIFGSIPTLNNTGNSGMGGQNTGTGAGSYYGAAGGTGMNGGGYGQADNGGGFNPDTHPRKLSKQEFYESPNNRKNRDRIVISSIVIIVCAIADWIKASFMVSLLRPQVEKLNELSEAMGMAGEYQIDLDAIMRGQIIASLFFIGLGVGIFIFKSRACALTGLIYSIVNIIYMVVTAHKFSGYYSLIAFGFATAATFAMAKAWADYEDHGDWTREW